MGKTVTLTAGHNNTDRARSAEATVRRTGAGYAQHLASILRDDYG